jgi:hypothetical protein
MDEINAPASQASYAACAGLAAGVFSWRKHAAFNGFTATGIP